MSRSALVVIPTYNERANLPVLVEGLMAHDHVRVLVCLLYTSRCV